MKNPIIIKNIRLIDVSEDEVFVECDVVEKNLSYSAYLTPGASDLVIDNDGDVVSDGSLSLIQMRSNDNKVVRIICVASEQEHLCEHLKGFGKVILFDSEGKEIQEGR